ncbi:nitrogenase molybdenum-iron protein alpha chain [Methanocella conradii HZ254]|uniref:Nitrogenase protein alpha chain n=1 Tax=Methanocella conradii (strain DSM 24694 / JCM 17849 / CGMCC 1.5162 / HZ254) TaxID=1041930 RepID=H8I6M4_METCZ|nr:nitrogenase molybdenum-iron protein alpha chain [Methanocella conradii]AFC98916.1 nitrogenase molybdenum-iron protein alpha chain [Methanocella conradii HZ254]MDI6898106.1 nitrogenase molybdenum-iron protein alpha chain [Methanocella conradii]
MAITDERLEEVLVTYPDNVKKNRKKHLLIKNSAEACQQIEANTRTIPGIISQRGCCFAGCKGVVIGPIKDMIHIVHGPVGCAYYSWGTRRNKARADETTPPENVYLPLCFTTDMQESDIVFGGEKKLAKMIDEVVEIFHPRAISICATCPVGLIGDDINAVARAAQERHGIQVLAFNCEGYKGVSQSAGHHIANNGLMVNAVGKGTVRKSGKYVINILGEYNIGGDGWEIERILKECGYTINCILPGDGSILNIRNLHLADLNLVQCHRSINYIAGMMEARYGMPWLKVNFIGVSACARSLREVAQCFGDESLIQRTEEVIARETARVMPVIEHYRKICQGKTAFVFVGGSRSHHYQYLLRDLGMETVVAGYEFAHRDDYEGREVLPTIKADADSKNIPDLHFEPDDEFYQEGHVYLNMPKEKYDELRKRIPLGYYEGMIKSMEDGQLIIDDVNHHEFEEIVRMLKPDIVFTGVRDKYISHKMGVPSRQLHSYDYTGPYAGFNGAMIFAREVANAVTTPAWRLVTAPWEAQKE